MRAHSLFLAVLCAVPAITSGQTLPTRTLTKADAEWTDPFSSIVGVRELRDGRVIVADNRDKVVQIVKFGGQATKIGREGSGPGEYGLPIAMYPAPGDSTWIFDALNARFLVIDPNGKPASTFTTVDPGAAPGGGQPTLTPGRGNDRGQPQQIVRGGALGFGRPEGIDANGRLYFRLPQISFGGETPRTVDSTPVVRWDRKTHRTDTVGVLVNPASAPIAAPRGSGGGAGGTTVTMRIGSSTPFGSADVWAVTPQGNVAIVRAKDYHVDWIINGKTSSGAPIKYDRVKITDVDKKAWVESRKNATGTMIIDDGSGRKVQNVSAAALGGNAPPDFPEFKGPFRSAVAGPNQQIWVDRHVPAGTNPTYDIIDGTGKVVGRVILPPKTRLIGFGNGTAYLVRTDDDDLQYLQRYRM